MGASVKIMLSYDYCHFEICKSTDENINDKQIDDMRKDVQRLADKAVKQYVIAKEHAQIVLLNKDERVLQEMRVKKILETPEGQRTLDEVAFVKAFNERNWDEAFKAYDYDDDYNGSF